MQLGAAVSTLEVYKRDQAGSAPNGNAVILYKVEMWREYMYMCATPTMVPEWAVVVMMRRGWLTCARLCFLVIDRAGGRRLVKQVRRMCGRQSFLKQREAKKKVPPRL